MFEAHWFWLTLGVVLIGLEIVTPGFVVIFFGFGAVFTGLLCLGVPELSELMQALIFALSSILSLVFLRGVSQKTFRGKTEVEAGVDNPFVGQYAVVTQPIGPGTPGKVSFNGTEWQAEAEGEFPAGARVRIARRDNITFIVEN